ncbi:MAG TPA: DUF1592 domain-containing protein [Candidatus Acidoferrum sp.]|nr:DUF1592 domain-containing protein [Candidatus Acidoferrum sp.]
MKNSSIKAAVVLVIGGMTAAGASAADDGKAQWHTIETYCVKCHNTDDWAGKVAFDTMAPDQVVPQAQTFEAAIRKLRGGLMPPPGNDRPPQAEITALANWIETTIDKAAGNEQVAGRVPLHRLNRREYQNAVHDLLGLDIKADKYLPVDNLKNGYDNNAEALQVSPAFIDQYLTAARAIAHDAIGDRRPIPIMETYGNVADMIISLPPRGINGTGTQQRHTEGMPFGTRGGVSVEHTFLADGEYELTIGDLALAREVPNMEFENTVIALLDGKEFFRTVIGGEKDHKWIDQVLDDAVAQINERLRKIRFHATAGQHNVTVTFLQRSFAESDELTPANALEGGQARLHAVHALQIRGPLSVTGMSDSESRKHIFVCYPKEKADEPKCAAEIVTHMAERAFRRPLTEQDTTELMAFYQKSRAKSDFETGIQEALSAILVSPHFLYRAETGNEGKTALALNDFELASRLSFFLWSTVPDDELLLMAHKGQLHEPKVLRAQVSRMLKDERAKTLITDFAGQWLNMAKFDEITPNAGQFRFASGRLDVRPLMREELNLFVDSVLRSDQSVTRLLDADYTFLNERLAMIYGIEDVKGSKMRRVHLDDPNRRGLLGKGAILLLTANPNRTSPVLRGSWILDRLLGTPPASPPPGVEALKENGFGRPPQTVRERLEQHRSKPMCMGCHGVMDPLGMALENFNTLGQFHVIDPETGTRIDSSGVLPDGTPISGPQDLVKALMARSDMFVQSLTQNLMTYALGRELNYRDMPVVRKIARAAAKDDNRFESIVYNIISADAFKERDGNVTDGTEGGKEAGKQQQASL